MAISKERLECLEQLIQFTRKLIGEQKNVERMLKKQIYYAEYAVFLKVLETTLPDAKIEDILFQRDLFHKNATRQLGLP